MITELSPELKSHIEEYIEEIEQNRINQSILKCPLNILDDYLHVLKQIDIDIEQREELKTYIDVALCVASKTVGMCRCSKIDVLRGGFNFEFEIHPQNLDWELFQNALNRACPQYYVSSKINYVYGLTMTTIQIWVQEPDKFRF